MLLLTLITLFLQFQGLTCQAVIPDPNGVSLDEKVLAIERLLLQPGTIMFPVTPCNEVLSGPLPIDDGYTGDQTAAQWVRTVFHDFITANVTTGTGGLDASVSFEADRDENLGLVFSDISSTPISFINATILGFNLFSNVFISTADFIALGLAASLLSCNPNSTIIPLKAGRIDASTPGPSGVPRPQDNLTIARTAFANAGFSQSEMIQAVACGHTLGSVHGENFPEIVGEQATVGTHQADHFDDTYDLFDNTGVSEYLNGSGKAGGPLVTTANETFQSDLRIFEADDNATISAMVDSFPSTCATVLAKMIDTVPSGVELSGVIGPRQWILIESHLDLSPTSGLVQSSGTIATYSWNSVPATASYIYGTAGGANVGPQLSDAWTKPSDTFILNGEVTVTTRPFGIVYNYAFNDTLSNTEINSIDIQSTYTEAVNLNLFILPSQSFVSTAGSKYVIRAALLTTLASSGTTLSGILYFAAGQPNSVAIKYTQVEFSLTSTSNTLGIYTIFQGTVANTAGALPSQGGGASHVDVHLGTAQKTPKIQVTSNAFIKTCSQTDLTLC